MGDILVGILAIAGLSVLLLLLGLRLGRRRSKAATTTLIVLAVAFLFAHALLLSDRLWLARLLPFSNVMVLGNWQLPCVAFITGLAWRATPGGTARKSVLLVPLVLVCLYRSYGWLPGEVPPLDDRWRGDVCLQTSPASCAAAAAATLLRAHGIDATEAEMARLCLTREAGTPNHGLYRGLKLKTDRTGWRVEVFRTDTAGLRSQDRSGPAVLLVRLDPGPGVDRRYEQLWGWTPGVNHTVVFFGFTEGGEKVDMGDPAVGREHWSARDLHVLWHGEGVRLVRDE